MASSQRSTLIPAEYPIVCGSTGDTLDSTCRPGVTFSTQTVRVPSDRRLIMIPASIPIPLNSIIAAVLFAPLSSSSTSNEAGNPSDILSGKAGRLYDAVSQAPADDCGTFVRLDIQPPPAEAQSLAERGRSVVAALIRNANAGNKGRLPTVAEESSGPDDSKGNSVQAVDDINDYDILTSISDIESDALTFGTNTPLLPPQILSTTHTSPEASSAASVSARGSKKRQLEEPEATDADKPKKPRNSFFYFRREYHRQANANGSRIKAKSISALAGREWQGMTEEQKEPYKLFAAEDTVRYKEEARVYKESLKKGKKKVKLVDRIGDTGVGYSVGYVVDASGTSVSYRSTPADGGMILSRLEPVPMLNNMGNSAHSVDILSYMSDMAVEVSAEFEHTPGLFGEPMILTVNPNGVLTTDISTQPTFVSADYNDHAIASGSMGPLPLAMTAQHHHSIFQPTSEQHQYAYEYHQYAPDHNSTYSHQHQQFAHHQPHLDYSQAHHAQMQQHWGSISSLLGNLGTPAVYNPFDESLLPVFSESGEPSLQSTMPESIRHTAHVDQAMTMLNSHQLNMATAVIGAESSAALNGPTSTSEHLTGIHPSIPDIEIVDASNSISLSTYSVARRR
ncbi:hypothetical protein GGI09_004351 [Coemansia sp. S100]|nr:hypothetical protein GGI09_004351 [Coemansia sp. S100]KAJ2347391.1 hypothetical protein GGH92_003220 [Coemansia sp. RSA 2673]